MLDFVKKVLNKDADALREAHSKDYFDNLLPQLRDAWMDNETLEQLGVNNFMKNVKYVHDLKNYQESQISINSQLTKEELVECLVGVNKMSHKCYHAEQMIDVFIKGYLMDHPEIQESFNKYVENKWHFEHEFRYNNDAYLLDVLRKLYNRISMSDDEVLEVRAKLSTKTKDELIENSSKVLNLIIKVNMLTARVMSNTVHSQLTLANCDLKLKKSLARREAYEKEKAERAKNKAPKTNL